MSTGAPPQSTTLPVRSPNRELLSPLSAPTSESLIVDRPSLGGFFGGRGDGGADARRGWSRTVSRSGRLGMEESGADVRIRGMKEREKKMKNKIYVGNK